MKKFLLALVLTVPMILVGCNGRETNNSCPRELTVAELDSIRHKAVNDSINNLDSIFVLKYLFMGMSKIEYDHLRDKALLPIKIGRLSFVNVDTLMFHGKVHNIILKAKDVQYVSDIDEMEKCVLYGGELFSDVVKTLSVKFGPSSWPSKMTELSESGRQIGITKWEFDGFSIEYTQSHFADLQRNEFRIDSDIKYSIPRVPTPEEKHTTDSIVKVRREQMEAEKQRNQEAIQSL